MLDEASVSCTECNCQANAFTTIAERWRYFQDGSGVFPYCPTCAERKFAPNAPPSAASSRRQARGQFDY